MRKFAFAFLVLAVAACDGGTLPTGPTDAPVTPAAPVAATSRMLAVAVDDAVVRLLPGIATDAAGPIGAALNTLAARLHTPADPSSVREALASARVSIDRFRGQSRADAATLDALRLELDVDH